MIYVCVPFSPEQTGRLREWPSPSPGVPETDATGFLLVRKDTSHLWSAFGLLRKFLHSLILSHYHYCISIGPCPKHNTRRHSLSMLVPRKKWPVSQLTGVYGIVRVPRDLDCTRLGDRSLLPWSKKVLTQPKFCIWMIRQTLTDDSQVRIEDTIK